MKFEDVPDNQRLAMLLPLPLTINATETGFIPETLAWALTTNPLGMALLGETPNIEFES